MKKLLLIILLAITININADTLMVAQVDVNAGQLSVSDVRSFYLMKYRRWPDGNRVILFQMPIDSPAHRHFIREVLRMSVSDYEKEWSKVVNSGFSSEIRYVYSSEEMLHRVSFTRNAIGYVDSDNIIVNSGSNDVKVLHISE